MWNNLINNYSELSSADKTHLLEETFKLAESGELSYEIPLNFINVLNNETNYVPWSVALDELINIKTYLYSSKYLSNYEVRRIIKLDH